MTRSSQRVPVQKRAAPDLAGSAHIPRGHADGSRGSTPAGGGHIRAVDASPIAPLSLQAGRRRGVDRPDHATRQPLRMPDLGRTSPASRDPEPPISAAHNRGAVESREASRSALIEPNISGRILSRRRPSRIYTYAPGDMMRRVATVLIGQAGPRVRLEDEAAYRCCCEGGMLGAWDDVGAASSWSWLCRPGPVGPTTPWRRAPVSTPPSMS